MTSKDHVMKGGRFEMPASLETVIAIVYIIILLTGLLLNLKQKFMAGFTFFLLLLFGRLINMYFARYAQRMLDGEIPTPENVHIDQLIDRSEEHTSELQSRGHLVCRLLLEKKNKKKSTIRRCT